MSLPVFRVTQVSDGRVSRQPFGAAEASAGPGSWRRQWKSAIHGMIGERTWEASTWSQSNVEHATTGRRNYEWGTL